MTQHRRQTDQRLLERGMPSLQAGRGGEGRYANQMRPNVEIDCGWGRLIFAQTFPTNEDLAASILAEEPGQRDIAFYIQDPQVVLAQAPQDLFLDPSITYRLDFATYRASRRRFRGFFIRRLCTADDAVQVNRIYRARHMVEVPPSFFWRKRDDKLITYFVAEDEATGAIIGTVTGIDHLRTFDDPEHGSSLWCLAVDPQASHPGIGEAMVRRLAEHYKARGRSYMDLSVMHDNEQAIALYEKIGFQRVPVFAIKRKNPINEKLFAGPELGEQADLNPYARIIIDEARRRGIGIEILDVEAALFRLTFGGRTITCRESLCDLTTAIAMTRCDDKALTRRTLRAAGVRVPDQLVAGDTAEMESFLARHGRVVVKPARGEQGKGITVDLSTIEDIQNAVESAKAIADTVLLEEFVEGEDVRVIVIDGRVVAAAIRRRPSVLGNGQDTVRNLIKQLGRRRAAATGGESQIPLDKETERCVEKAGYSLDDILPNGTAIDVRKTANLHTGGTIHDVTDGMHRSVVDAAIASAKALEIPVVGMDFMMPDVLGSDYVAIEANERPGLANHEPQPTAERFVDLLFPLSRPAH